MGIFWTGIFPGNFPGGSLMVRNFPDRDFPGEFMQGSLMGGNSLGGNFLGGSFPDIFTKYDNY